MKFINETEQGFETLCKGLGRVHNYSKDHSNHTTTIQKRPQQNYNSLNNILKQDI